MPTRHALAAALALCALAVPPASAQEIACQNGVAVLPDVGSFPCRDVDLVGYLSRSAFGLEGSPEAAHNDVWGWTDPQTGTEYALVGTRNGTAFVDLSTPTAPRVVGKLPTTNVASLWRDVKTVGHYALVVADNSSGHGMQVFDLTRLRGQTGAPVLFTPDAVYTGIASAHNVVVNEATGFAYAVGARYPIGERARLGLPPECDVAGFHAINVQDPQRPTFAGCFSDVAREADPYVGPGYTHDAQCLVYGGPDADYAGRELCFAANEDVVTVFDVTDKGDVRIVSQGEYPLDAYTHQGWLTADQRYFLVNDEIDESQQIQDGQTPSQRTIVLDLLDLDSPEVAFIYDSGLTTIDHNLYVRGRYAFESNYETGLRILDLERIGEGEVTEVAFFDTYPASDSVSYNGQWSNYPYFESGLVVANDINNGLFVLRPAAALAVAEGGGPAAPAGYELSDPFPNPTAVGARLTLRVDETQAVRAELYDVAGRRVAEVFSGTARPGAEVRLEVPGVGLPAGVYVVRVVGERFEASRRLTLTR